MSSQNFENSSIGVARSSEHSAVEVGHEDALLGVEDLRGLAHEAHARDHHRLRAVRVAEARHLERVRDGAAGRLREVLQVGVDVVVRDEDGVALLQERVRLLDERRRSSGVTACGGFAGAMP
jgi:hypothetical protein